MKRQISKTTHKDPSPIIGATLPQQSRRLRVVRSSDFRIPNPTSQSTKDISCRKRVKLTNLDVNIPLSCRRNASPTALEGRQSPRSDDPKTSEFAFFKKLKENTGRKYESHTLHKEENQSKKFRISDCAGGNPNSVKFSCKDFSSSLLAENVTPSNFSSHLSPLGGASKKSGGQHGHGEIFSKKRHKLRKWVVETSYPHIEELCSKGYDFVSLLLSRLFPEGNKNSGFKKSKSRQVDIDTKSQFLTSLELHSQLKKLSHMPARNYMELDHVSHLDDGSSSCWLNRSPEGVLSNFYTPPNNASIACLEYEMRETDYEVGGRSPVLCTQCDSTYGFQSKRYGSLAYNHLKELDDLHYPKKCLIKSGSNPLLLGWDFGRNTEERNSSNTCQNTELNLYSPSSSSLGDYHQHILDERIGAKELSESSFLSTNSPNVISFPWSHSANYNELDFGKQVEDKEDINADFNHFPLALTLAPDYLTLAEDHKNDTKCKDSSIFFSPHNLDIMSKVFGERYHHPGFEGVLLSSGLDLDLEWDCPSLSGSSRKHHPPVNCAFKSPRNEGTYSCFLLKDKSESFLDGSSHRGTLSHVSDIVNIQDLSSFYFQMSLEKDRPCPLLLNKSSWDGT
ncbi:uncharacterized protein LOC115952620 isoform X2 [Quercus lobata]|uniref:Uncharacterized protein n=1 Tax=Quercus lobata TaxID=97700 RepID=A0A7N2M370_QUELO|nr:uncharacterized protein LOC115952620 isoform X2 [Quercus lobata]